MIVYIVIIINERLRYSFSFTYIFFFRVFVNTLIYSAVRHAAKMSNVLSCQAYFRDCSSLIRSLVSDQRSAIRLHAIPVLHVFYIIWIRYTAYVCIILKSIISNSYVFLNIGK